ncbi:divergent AAA domain protein [archaeon BMS3Abin16]|nr:divergent AAA domain protein [archaeon BMS3Abin16]
MVNDEVQLHLKHLLSMGEGLRVEYKEAKKTLPVNLFETVCAMLNRDGGDILLGVDDNGQVIGVDVQYLGKLKTDIVNLSNNPQKLDPPFILFPVERSLEGKAIIHISIPASSQTHRSIDVVYDRSDDGDFRVSEPHRIAEISNRKRAAYTENTIYGAVTPDDLRFDMLPRLRNLMLSRSPNHPWPELTDEELMLKAGLYRKDIETGKEGYTLAAVLLLGKDETIHSALPHYKIDALVRRVQVDRYDDRDRIECNLIEAYDRLMAFVAKHLPDPFYLEGDVRISLRDRIFREVVANVLVHREYVSAYPARLIIYKDRVETVNASNYRTKGMLDPKNVVPFSKNPTIAKFFAQIGWVEELGSGMVNIGKYVPHYSPGRKPEYRDGAVFTTMIPLPVIKDVAEKVYLETADDFRVKFSENFRVKFNVKGNQLDRMTEMILRPSSGRLLVVKELAEKYSVSVRTIHEDLRRLEGWNIVTFEGPPKTGTYILTEYGKALLEDVV